MEQKSLTFFPNYVDDFKYQQLIENTQAYLSKATLTVSAEPFLNSLKAGNFSMALRQACSVSSDYLVEILLAYLNQTRPEAVAACINEPSFSNGRSALHWAAFSAKTTRKISVLAALLEAQPHPPALQDHQDHLYQDYLDEDLQERLKASLNNRDILMDDDTWKLEIH